MPNNGKVAKTTYSEQIADIVRKRIRNGELRSGDHISEVALAAECGISRAPVREALYLLEAEGLLDSHPGKGKRIITLTSDDIRNRYELCGILEGAAAASVIANKPESIFWDNLDAILAKMRHDVDINAPVEVHAEMATMFHEALLEPARNRLLVNTARSSCRVVSKYLLYQQWRTIFSPGELYARHLDIFIAMRTMDLIKVESAIRNHYAESAERMTNFASR